MTEVSAFFGQCYDIEIRVWLSSVVKHWDCGESKTVQGVIRCDQGQSRFIEVRWSGTKRSTQDVLRMREVHAASQSHHSQGEVGLHHAQEAEHHSQGEVRLHHAREAEHHSQGEVGLHHAREAEMHDIPPIVSGMWGVWGI